MLKKESLRSKLSTPGLFLSPNTTRSADSISETDSETIVSPAATNWATLFFTAGLIIKFHLLELNPASFIYSLIVSPGFLFLQLSSITSAVTSFW